MNNGNLKLAIQKEGRLTEDTLNFLRAAGLEFESYRKKLFSSCRNFPLEILYVRDDDIPDYVVANTVDLGIVGQNLLYEKQSKVELLLSLRYGFCSLVVATPKESNIRSVEGLKDLKVATAYPNSTRHFFERKNVSVQIVKISGSVEITPALGVASAIVDLASTGSTLALNDLHAIEKIYDSEAVLIANGATLHHQKKKEIVEKLLVRFKGVLAAKDYKYIMMNAPRSILPRLREIIPGLKSPTISTLAEADWISVQTVIKEDVFWETIERLKKLGATGIIVLPIEKLIL